MEIPEIKIRELDIPQWSFNSPSTSIPLPPPVVVNIGVPVVDIPGCVEAHESNSKSKTVGQDDEAGLVTYCDSGIPSFNPIQFEPDQMIFTEPAKTPKVRPPEAPELPNTPEIKPPASTAKIDCPTPAQQIKEPVGTYLEGFRKRITEYKLLGNECVQITESVPLPKQSALMAKPLADLLLKAVKPTVKKVMKKISAIRKKDPIVKSAGARRAEQRQMNHAVRELRSVFPRRKR